MTDLQAHEKFQDIKNRACANVRAATHYGSDFSALIVEEFQKYNPQILDTGGHVKVVVFRIDEDVRYMVCVSDDLATLVFSPRPPHDLADFFYEGTDQIANRPKTGYRYVEEFDFWMEDDGEPLLRY